MVRIEKLLLESKNNLRLLNPDLHYSLVYAFRKMQHKSEIIYLKEPHILKKNLNFHPGSARHDDKLFLTLQQFSVEFITQLVTVASLNCSQESLNWLA